MSTPIVRVAAEDQIAPRSRKRSRGKAAGTIALGDAARAVLNEAPSAMTLRQLYYALVSSGAAEKTEASYGRLKRVMRELREAGTVPWQRLVDHTRAVYEPRTWDGIEALLRDSARMYRRDLMRYQNVAVQLWAESDSIGSVIQQKADHYCIPTFIGRGYAARGYLWEAAKDAAEAHAAGKTVHILHVGDHDPSGEDIFRDVEQTLRTYALAVEQGQSVMSVRITETPSKTDWLHAQRLALTAAQVDQYSLPVRPAKASDVRTAKFTGRGAVEVEALPLEALLNLVEAAIQALIDPEALRVAEIAEQSERDTMRLIANRPIEQLAHTEAAPHSKENGRAVEVENRRREPWEN